MKNRYWILLLIFCGIQNTVSASNNVLEFKSQIKYYFGIHSIKEGLQYGRYSLDITIKNKTNKDFKFKSYIKNNFDKFTFENGIIVLMKSDKSYIYEIVIKNNEEYTFHTNSFIIPQNENLSNLINAYFNQTIKEGKYNPETKKFEGYDSIKYPFKINFDKNNITSIFPVFPYIFSYRKELTEMFMESRN